MYDLSVHEFNTVDMSNSKIDISGVTRPTDFGNSDVSQNTTYAKVTTSTISLGVQHKDVAGTLDISGYTITYDVNGSNSDAGSQTISAKNVLATDSSDNVVVSGLTYPNSTYTMNVNLFNVHDMSNSNISVTGNTRPSDFVSSDVTQNKPTTTDTNLVLNVNSSQDANSLAIKSYVIGFNGSNGDTTDIETRTLTPGDTTANAINTNVTLTNMLSNTTYDLSAHLINDVDLSNSILTSISGTTRPKDFVKSNFSQMIGETTSTKLVMSVTNNQNADSLQINKYEFDVSGNNGDNATLQTINKVPVNQGPTASNTDVSLNDLSANTMYNLSVNEFNSADMSNSKIDISGVTRPTDFNNNGTDVSQNMTGSDLSDNRIIMNIIHKDVEGTLDISGYTIKYTVRGDNSDSNTITKTALVKSAHLSNLDVSVNSLQYPNSIYDMSVNLFNVHDMSNAFIDISGLTKPRDFVTTDVSQNKATTTSTTLMMNINSKQDTNSLAIKNYVIDFSGNNGSNASDGTKTLTPSTTTAQAINTDVALTDLSANTTYDLSAHLINSEDMSNNKLVSSGTTRPSDFVKADISQNIASTTSSKLVMKIHNSQITGTLDINKYGVDVSGNNGDNASLQTVNKVPVNQGASETNNDVSLNDLSANTLYDLSINMFNTQDMSSGKIDISGVTRPTDFNSNGTDVSQNMTGTELSDNRIVMNIIHKDLEGTLDISGYTITYSARDNSDSNTITKTALVKSAHLSNLDVSINNLQYANTTYDMSINLFNIYDMSNTKIDISGTTKPSNFASGDISQNVSDTSANTIVLKINNSQQANTLDISGYTIDISGENNFSSSKKTIIKIPTDKSANSANADVSLNDLSANTKFDISINLVSSVLDLSNDKLKITGSTAPTPFTSNDVSQTSDYSNNQIILSAQHKDLAGTLDMSAITVYYNAKYVSSSGDETISPSTVNLVNNDGTTHDRQNTSSDNGQGVQHIIDGTANTYSTTTISQTTSSHGPFILSFGIPSSAVNKRLSKIKIKWDPNYGTLDAKFGYRRSSNNYSLNMTDVENIGSGSSSNGTVDVWNNDTDWHIENAESQGAGNYTTITFNKELAFESGDNVLVRWNIDYIHNEYKVFAIYEIEFVLNNNFEKTATITKIPVNKAPNALNNDISLNNLSGNMKYDLSINLINSENIDGDKLGLTTFTRPNDFSSSDISQNISDTSSNSIVININNAQDIGSLDISGYQIDISGDNQFATSKKTVINTATTKTPEGRNTDVTVNDLSANTKFDLSINIIGSNLDLSNSKLHKIMYTAPSKLDSDDMSQVKDYSNNQVILSVQHNDLAGTSDIKTITVQYKGDYATSNGDNPTDITPSSVELVNVDGTTHSKQNTNSNNGQGIQHVISGTIALYSIVTLSNTVDSDGPFILKFGIPSAYTGKILQKIKMVYDDGYGPIWMKFGYISSSNKVSLNLTAADTIGNNATVNTGTVSTWNNDTDWHVENTDGQANNTSNFTFDSTYSVKENDFILIRWKNYYQYNDYRVFALSDVKFTFVDPISKSGTISKAPTLKGSNAINSDISLNDLSGNMKYDLSINLINDGDIDGEENTLSVYTRPNEITNANISQNVTDSSSNAIVFSWNKGQDVGSADISGFIFDVSGHKSDGSFYDGGTVTLSASNAAAAATNNDVTLSNLVANTRYDFSANQFNIYDMSQVNMIDISGTTKPSDFGVNDVSQNLTDASTNKIVLNINKGQPLLSLNIDKFTIDYSGNNGTNATTGTVIVNATNTSPSGVLTDISINDLSANTRYDLSVNQINSNDISGDKIGLFAVTRPSDFSNNDISQNIEDSSANVIVLNINNSQINGSLDISGYIIKYGANILNVKPQNVKADGINTDISINSLDANTAYDISVSLVGYYNDLSNSEYKITTDIATAPTPFTSDDVSQVADYSDNQVILSAQHKDLVGTLDMSAVTIFYKGNLGNGEAITNVTPDSINLINLDGTSHDYERNDINDAIDGGNGSDTYVTTTGTNSTHGPFVLEFGFPSSLIGKNLHKVKARWGSGETGTLSLAFGYRRSSTNYSLNFESGENLGTGATVNTGELTFNTTSAFHIEDSVSSMEPGAMYVFDKSYVIQSGDTLLIRWLNAKPNSDNKHWRLYEVEFNVTDGYTHSDTVTKIPINKGPADSNNDISLNDLKGNMKYDLSVNLVNAKNVTGDKIDLIAYTRPNSITNSNISQNIPDSSSNSIVFNWNKGQLANSSDISGFVFDISGYKSDGSFYDGGRVTLSASNKSASVSLTDISINSLVANTRYDFSANQFNIYDMSQVNMIDIS
tara:strand:- start:3085 stop:10017 length:6933 start_codon:yes stop_codon:yes gene_type:complete